MIVSKPPVSTLTSFTLFLLVTAVVIGMNVFAIVQTPSPAWYNYLIIGVLLPLGGYVLYKIFIRYQIVRFGNNRVEVYLPVLRQSGKYNLDQIQFWFENQVKTGKNSVYKELVIKFADNRKVTLSPKESTEYEKVVQYLKQKVAKKKIAIQ
jgi:hypothetical protein